MEQYAFKKLKRGTILQYGLNKDVNFGEWIYINTPDDLLKHDIDIDFQTRRQAVLHKQF